MTTNNEVIDSQSNEKENNKLYSAFVWWEKKRFVFNAVVGGAGFLGLFLSGLLINQYSIAQIIFYGLLVNLCYSTGFLLEAFDLHYFKSKLKIDRFRFALFILGLISVTMVTFVGAFFSPLFNTYII